MHLAQENEEEEKEKEEDRQRDKDVVNISHFLQLIAALWRTKELCVKDLANDLCIRLENRGESTLG